MFCASHIGRDHQRIGRNNQDGAFATATIAVVTDGCSSQPQSEVGAQLGARFLGHWLSQQTALSESLPRHATDALAAFLQQTSLQFGREIEPILERYFLFTFLAALRVGERAMIFGLGDGGFAVGALLAGGLADAFDISFAILAVAAVTAASGIVVFVRMYETHPRHERALIPEDVDLKS
jgi:hypothetical protein